MIINPFRSEWFQPRFLFFIPVLPVRAFLGCFKRINNRTGYGTNTSTDINTEIGSPRRLAVVGRILYLPGFSPRIMLTHLRHPGGVMFFLPNLIRLGLFPALLPVACNLVRHRAHPCPLRIRQRTIRLSR